MDYIMLIAIMVAASEADLVLELQDEHPETEIVFGQIGTTASIPCIGNDLDQQMIQDKFTGTRYVDWKDDKNLDPWINPRYKPNEYNMSITDVQPQDEGTYKCIISTHNDPEIGKAQTFSRTFIVYQLPLYWLEERFVYKLVRRTNSIETSVCTEILATAKAIELNEKLCNGKDPCLYKTQKECWNDPDLTGYSLIVTIKTFLGDQFQIPHCNFHCVQHEIVKKLDENGQAVSALATKETERLSHFVFSNDAEFQNVLVLKPGDLDELLINDAEYGIKFVPEQLKVSKKQHCEGGYEVYELVCVPCKPGSYSTSGSSKCSLCHKNYFQDKYAMAECYPCPHGLHTVDIGAQTSELCLENGEMKSTLDHSLVGKFPISITLALFLIIIIIVFRCKKSGQVEKLGTQKDKQHKTHRDSLNNQRSYTRKQSFEENRSLPIGDSQTFAQLSSDNNSLEDIDLSPRIYKHPSGKFSHIGDNSAASLIDADTEDSWIGADTISETSSRLPKYEQEDNPPKMNKYHSTLAVPLINTSSYRQPSEKFLRTDSRRSTHTSPRLIDERSKTSQTKSNKSLTTPFIPKNNSSHYQHPTRELSKISSSRRTFKSSRPTEEQLEGSFTRNNYLPGSNYPTEFRQVQPDFASHQDDFSNSDTEMVRLPPPPPMAPYPEQANASRRASSRSIYRQADAYQNTPHDNFAPSSYKVASQPDTSRRLSWQDSTPRHGSAFTKPIPMYQSSSGGEEFTLADALRIRRAELSAEEEPLNKRVSSHASRRDSTMNM